MKARSVKRYTALRASLFALLALIALTLGVDVLAVWVSYTTAGANPEFNVPLVIEIKDELWTSILVHGVMLLLGGGALIELRLLKHHLTDR